MVEGGWGLAPLDIDKQLAVIKKRGAAGDAEFWNDYLTKDRRTWLNSEPNGFLGEL